MSSLVRYAASFWRSKDSERGQDAAEYALLTSLIAVAIVGAVALVGGELAEFWEFVQQKFLEIVP